MVCAETETTGGHATFPRAQADPDGITDLFERYYDLILSYTARRLLNMSDAEDVTAETFSRALTALPSMSPVAAARRAWLYRTATNLIHDLRRRRGARPEVPLATIEELGRWIADPARDPESHANQLEELREIVRALRSLPDKYENVLVLRFFEELKITEIADVLGIRPGTVKWRVHAALRKLGAVLTADPSFERLVTRKGE
ncbi:MAG: RNA polymerase sigma factor [Acidobacteria bacterium]|nr:RNA polymerase sigma factor [Acidobacteriota bacterium]